jgi:preprotein translocase subunit SecA
LDAFSTMSLNKEKKSITVICFGTNEFGFTSVITWQLIRGPVRADILIIVDESVFVDEARTPLIISGPVDVDDHKFDEMKPRIERIYRKQKNYIANILLKQKKFLKRMVDTRSRCSDFQSLQRLTQE